MRRQLAKILAEIFSMMVYPLTKMKMKKQVV